MAQQEHRERVVVIVGPTASGKSTLAVELAKKFNGEILSADSRQVYKGLDIGTGKITEREMKGVRHHLLDVASPKKQFAAHEFAMQARAAIADIASRGKTPIICGGTGFYIDALLGRIRLSEVEPDHALRARLNKRSTEQLFMLLKKKDPRRATTIDRHNKRRIIRALEIATHTENSSRYMETTENCSRYEVLWIGLRPDTEVLRQRINARLNIRLKSGMVAEARKLHANGLSYKRMRELGLEYRSLARFLQQEISREELERALQFAIWHYAKRQMTYWRKNKEIRWSRTAADAQRSVKLDMPSPRSSASTVFRYKKHAANAM